MIPLRVQKYHTPEIISFARIRIKILSTSRHIKTLKHSNFRSMRVKSTPKLHPLQYLIAEPITFGKSRPTCNMVRFTAYRPWYSCTFIISESEHHTYQVLRKSRHFVHPRPIKVDMHWMIYQEHSASGPIENPAICAPVVPLSYCLVVRQTVHHWPCHPSLLMCLSVQTRTTSSHYHKLHPTFSDRAL